MSPASSGSPRGCPGRVLAASLAVSRGRGSPSLGVSGGVLAAASSRSSLARTEAPEPLAPACLVFVLRTQALWSEPWGTKKPHLIQQTSRLLLLLDVKSVTSGFCP